MRITKLKVAGLLIACCLNAVNSIFAEDLALVNEVVISSKPVHENVAEKYIREATGEKSSITTDTSNSAFKVFVPVEDHIKTGTAVSTDLADYACLKLKQHLRKLRKDNNQRRSNKQTVKIIYNFDCSPNIIISTSAIPNDPKFRDLWGLNYGLDTDMDLPQAWDKTTGSSEVVVAIIDTGIDYSHPDLSQNMWKNPAEAAGQSGVDDDGNGIIDDIYGYNSVNNSGNPMDDNNHGTHCAGTIGAVGNNSTGVVGVNQNVKMMAVKFLEASGTGSLMNAIKSIDYVTNQKIAGVNIVASNNSWGWLGGTFITSIRDAIIRASNNNILFVAAAGNNGINIDDNAFYPASYEVDNIISVAASTANGDKSSFSNYSSSKVDVIAPGSSILSTTINNTYQLFSGTSMAAPHISGAIALLKGYSASASMNTIKDILFKSGKRINGAIGKTKYEILPSAYEMLLEADRRGIGGISPIPPATPTPRPTFTPTATPTATATATATPTTAPGYWDIKGNIDVSGKKLPLAKIILKVNGQTYITYSDAQGAYSFNNVYGPAQYSLEVISAGQQFTVQTGTLTNHINTNFSGSPKIYKLTAKLIDHNGNPVANHVVGESISGAKLTNSSGLAEFSLPYGAAYNLSVDSSDKDFLDFQSEGVIKGDVTRVFVVMP